MLKLWIEAHVKNKSQKEHHETWPLCIKGAWANFSEWWSNLSLNDNHFKDVFQFNLSNHLDVWSNSVYCSCQHLTVYAEYMVTKIGHVFTNIFQVTLISAAKFAVGYEKI